MTFEQAIADIQGRGLDLWHLAHHSDGQWHAVVVDPRAPGRGVGGEPFSPTVKGDTAVAAILGAAERMGEGTPQRRFTDPAVKRMSNAVDDFVRVAAQMRAKGATR